MAKAKTQKSKSPSAAESGYALIRTGGKQYRVHVGQVLEVELVDAGEDVTFDQVLAVKKAPSEKLELGAPLVEGATVKAKVVSQLRGEKKVIFKKRRRQGYRRKNGHRQELLRVRIESIA
ncbi:MAG: 50S ribosomal protein L21 [Bdellovibrionales bacterium]|nr:50S ribosomal protein L21 [Bdellovibrionales bacterium]